MLATRSWRLDLELLKKLGKSRDYSIYRFNFFDGVQKSYPATKSDSCWQQKEGWKAPKEGDENIKFVLWSYIFFFPFDFSCDQ